MTVFYFIRHAESDCNNHDDRARGLTAKGLADRKLVTDFLADKQIDLVLSSPYRRAVDTVQEFADTKGYEVGLVEDFRERNVGGQWVEDFAGFCRRQWEDFDYKLSDGESLREVQTRNLTALRQVLAEHEGENIVVGSHGTALGTIIHAFDPTFDYSRFQKIIHLMPWVVRFRFEDSRCMDIQTYNLFQQ